MYRLTLPHLDMQRFMDLFHHSLNVIPIEEWLVPLQCLISCKCQPGVHTLDGEEWGALGLLGRPIVHSKLSHG